MSLDEYIDNKRGNWVRLSNTHFVNPAQKLDLLIDEDRSFTYTVSRISRVNSHVEGSIKTYKKPASTLEGLKKELRDMDSSVKKP